MELADLSPETQQQGQCLLQPDHRCQPSNQPPPSALFDHLARNNPIIDNSRNFNAYHNSLNQQQQQQQQQHHHHHHCHSSDEHDHIDCFVVLQPPPPPLAHHNNPPFATAIMETVEHK